MGRALPELIGAGHLDTLRDAAASSAGVIHLAFDTRMAFSGDFAGAANADRRAIEIFGP